MNDIATGFIAGGMIGVFFGALFMAINLDAHVTVKKNLQAHLDQQLEAGNAFYDPKTAELRIAVCEKK